MPSLPTGTVTLLFTDIEGSTSLLQRLGDRRYAEILAEHRRLLRAAFEEGGGCEVDTQGDAFLVAFATARDALATAVAAQRALTKHAWPDGAPLRVRMGLHTGEPISEGGGYAGLDVHRAARICAAGHGGQILLSHVVSGLASRGLPPGVSLLELGTHRLKDLPDPEHLFQVVHPDLPREFPAIKSVDARPNNLPIQLTSFIGRSREIGEVQKLLGAARLVTLTGSGGAGKTRLALQVAAGAMERHPDGAWLAELAPVADPALVAKTVASAFNVPEQPARDLTETLVAALRPKSALLVLDNCEHLLAACRDFAAALLQTCPKMRILATSREGLGVPGETLWRVPSLSLPNDAGRLPAPDELILYDAVRLFLDRAAAMAPGFAVTAENGSAVAQICRRLDGIPLAIELAAARAKVLTVEQIAVLLDDRFRLLTGGSPVLAPRHQMLRAAIDWSYNLLSDPEQVLLRRLSVFAGGWSLAAAESVCAGERVEARDILDLLTSLVDKSLVLAETQHAESRYRLLETVRQYARDRLVEGGEERDVRSRHRAWCVTMAEQAPTELRGPRQRLWLNRLAAEHDNLRAALASGMEDPGGTDAALRLVGGLTYFWFLTGNWREARGWLDQALNRRGDAPRAVLPRAYWGATAWAYLLGDYGGAKRLGEEGLAIAREVGDKRSSTALHMHLGVVALLTHAYGEAAERFEEGTRLARELGNRWEESVGLTHRGVVWAREGDLARATALQEEALAIMREIGDTAYISYTLCCLADVALQKGDDHRAASFLIEGLRLAREAGFRSNIRACLIGLAYLSGARRQHDRAARLFGAAEALREIIGNPSPQGRPEYDQRLASTRSGLGDAAFAAAWAEGGAMPLEQAIEYALGSEPG